MESKIGEPKTVIIEFERAEAIVFLDWLHRFNEKSENTFFEDQAEERVLWDMESCLEQVMEETLSSDYDKVLRNARDNVRDVKE